MKKRTSGRLQLHRETLRILGRNALGGVVGADPNDCTFLCDQAEPCSEEPTCNLPPSACFGTCSC